MPSSKVSSSCGSFRSLAQVQRRDFGTGPRRNGAGSMRHEKIIQNLPTQGKHRSSHREERHSLSQKSSQSIYQQPEMSQLTMSQAFFSDPQDSGSLLSGQSSARSFTRHSKFPPLHQNSSASSAVSVRGHGGSQGSSSGFFRNSQGSRAGMSQGAAGRKSGSVTLGSGSSSGKKASNKSRSKTADRSPKNNSTPITRNLTMLSRGKPTPSRLLLGMVPKRIGLSNKQSMDTPVSRSWSTTPCFLGNNKTISPGYTRPSRLPIDARSIGGPGTSASSQAQWESIRSSAPPSVAPSCPPSQGNEKSINSQENEKSVHSESFCSIEARLEEMLVKRIETIDTKVQEKLDAVDRSKEASVATIQDHMNDFKKQAKVEKDDLKKQAKVEKGDLKKQAKVEKGELKECHEEIEKHLSHRESSLLAVQEDIVKTQDAVKVDVQAFNDTVAATEDVVEDGLARLEKAASIHTKSLAQKAKLFIQQIGEVTASSQATLTETCENLVRKVLPAKFLPSQCDKRLPTDLSISSMKGSSGGIGQKNGSQMFSKTVPGHAVDSKTSSVSSAKNEKHRKHTRSGDNGVLALDSAAANSKTSPTSSSRKEKRRSHGSGKSEHSKLETKSSSRKPSSGRKSAVGRSGSRHRKKDRELSDSRAPSTHKAVKTTSRMETLKDVVNDGKDPLEVMPSQDEKADVLMPSRQTTKKRKSTKNAILGSQGNNKENSTPVRKKRKSCSTPKDQSTTKQIVTPSNESSKHSSGKHGNGHSRVPFDQLILTNTSGNCVSPLGSNISLSSPRPKRKQVSAAIPKRKSVVTKKARTYGNRRPKLPSCGPGDDPFAFF